MNRWLAGACCALALLVSPRPAAAFIFTSGNNSRAGDLVAVWVKNGFELILNLGPVDSIPESLPGFAVPNEFDNNLSGAKFTALAVPNPVMTYPGFNPPLPDANIAMTSLADPTGMTYVQVANAQAGLDAYTGGIDAWLRKLNTIDPAGGPGTQIIENTDTRLVISTSLFASYTGNIGFATDQIANTISVSTATIVDPNSTGDPYSIDLWYSLQVRTPVKGTDVSMLGTFNGDAGSSGTGMLSFAPEPEGAAAAALLAVAFLARRRRRPSV